MVPKRGDWVEFTYQKVSTFVNADMSEDKRLSNRYAVVGQIDKVGENYILLAELSKSPKVGSKPVIIDGKILHKYYRAHRFERIRDLHKVSSRGIDIISPPQMEDDNGTEV